MSNGKIGFSFREKMVGGFALGETDPATGAEKGKSTILTMHGAITIDDIDAFRSDPNHAGVLDVHMDWSPFGIDVPAPGGVFNLFSPSGNPQLKLMVYEWGVTREGERRLTRVIRELSSKRQALQAAFEHADRLR